jgi:hypothetical protein
MPNFNSKKPQKTQSIERNREAQLTRKKERKKERNQKLSQRKTRWQTFSTRTLKNCTKDSQRAERDKEKVKAMLSKREISTQREKTQKETKRKF